MKKMNSKKQTQMEQNPFKGSAPESLKSSESKATFSIKEDEALEPFRVVEKDKDDKKTYFCAIMNFQVSEEMESFAACEKMIKEKDWKLILGLMMVVKELKNF